MTFNKFSLLILGLSGAAIIFYALLKRLRKEAKAPVYDPQKDDPVIHIKNKLFLEIPVEKILFGYFILVSLVYLTKIIAGERLPGVDLAVLYLSGIIFFLVLYKMTLIAGVVNKFTPWLLFSLLFSLLIFLVVYGGFGVDLIPFLADTGSYHLTIHLLGLVLGLGGTMVIDIMFTHFLRKYKISPQESVIMHLISQMIILGLILLILSGTALLLPSYTFYLENSRFLMKMTVVFVIIINGGLLNFYVTPKIKKISLLKEGRGRHENLKKISFALGAISIISWFLAFILAMLKDVFNLAYSKLLLAYLIFLIFGIIASQMAKLYYERKEIKENEN
ncbi:MAG: hypothetical protein H0V01_09145 [Bacteroidetes bacterium]|nr:hypothetical protein [Bacteroidota bacterium]HET6243095.1 hypothetical protein [Bacteroidia bacterium]